MCNSVSFRKKYRSKPYRHTAKKLTSLFSCVATVSVGIHIDNAEKEEIELLVRNFEQCIKILIKKLRKII